jgi:hypothetical protein
MKKLVFSLLAVLLLAACNDLRTPDALSHGVVTAVQENHTVYLTNSYKYIVDIKCEHKGVTFDISFLSNKKYYIGDTVRIE